MTLISAVVIAFNEEKNIKRCIESFMHVVDDIVVVDSYSTDNTVAIAESLGARVIQHKFDGHIQQKNWAITQAKYPHILSLDADEALSEELAIAVKKAKGNWDADGYRVRRLTQYCGKWIQHCGWYPDIKLRLFDSRKGAWGGTNPHDKYELIQGGKQHLLDGDLLHYSFYSIEQHVQTVDKFSSIKAQALFERGKKASLVKMAFGPCVRFVQDYVFKRGFLDGFYGYVICKNNAHSIFLKEVKLHRLWNGA